MNRNLGKWLKQYGSVLVLVIVALAVLFVGRTTVADALFSSDNEPITLQSATIAVTATIAPIAIIAPEQIADEPEQFFDLSNVPTLRDEPISPALDPITYQGKLPEHTFETYIVERGDVPVKIAERFDIEPETLLGGNPHLSEEAGLLQVGDELIILPVNGALHTVRPGETVESVALLYGVSAENILDYAPNNLEFPFRLYPDTQIIVPGAVVEVFKWDPPALPSSSGTSVGGVQLLIQGTGTFVWPVNGRNISQTYWYGHPAIDVALVEGSPTYASDTGTVTYAAWSPYCYGNLIVINHGNGFETFYAHLSGINVVPGQIVYQGNLIGYTGNTGCSSGPHIHFEVRANGNRDDPLWWLP